MSVRHTLAAALLLAACGGGEPPALIGEFDARSALVECRQLAWEEVELTSITNVRPATDSTMLVVDAGGRQVVMLDADARQLARIEFPAEGPGSISRLLDAAASGDSLIVVADGGRHRLVGMTSTGAELWALDARFPPQSVAFAGERLLVAALGMDPRIAGLLHERREDRLVPLDIPFITHHDALARMLVNSATVHGLPDGSAVVAHEMVWPRAWIVPATGDARRVDVPVPSAVAERVGFLPPMPMREDDIDDLLIPVMGLTVDPATGDIFYVTRSGNQQEGRSEKAIIRASAEFAYLGSVRLPINAVKVVFLPRSPDSLIVTDFDLRWHRCPLPPGPATPTES